MDRNAIISYHLWQEKAKTLGDYYNKSRHYSFYRAAWMQTRSSDENSVRPSVRPCVSQTRALWQNGRKICPDFYTIREIIYLTFLKRRMVGGGDSFCLKFWVNWPQLERNRRFWTDYSPVAPQP